MKKDSIAEYFQVNNKGILKKSKGIDQNKEKKVDFYPKPLETFVFERSKEELEEQKLFEQIRIDETVEKDQVYKNLYKLVSSY